ncbi:TPA: hypothetical protein I9092_000719 [Clostridium perfringens]|uniref:Uncharacterized protein n=1 Tax=Clostridium perfringens TaxID=1502 RepID=A0AB37C8V3_CLOPF|nr:hypothetical protein [Clostridium perfringens]AQW27809.1 hypothetical protein BXT94_13825 [Clostridium perfringens]ASY52496.1 hypothetical protein BG908_12735 [Clostridium perfringens]AWS27027.1 hypothetical protein CYK96_15735 [Clostridium perfringens]KQC91876.1 hypothetical protein AM596_12555 [Clostridium perfringens CP4]MBO3423081.1 hypothetical protein [Clostridium perfringens]
MVNKQYNLFLAPQFNKLTTGARLRVDLLVDMKIKNIPELKFTIKYVTKGYEDLVKQGNLLVPRKVRYIEIFKK